MEKKTPQAVYIDYNKSDKFLQRTKEKTTQACEENRAHDDVD